MQAYHVGSNLPDLLTALHLLRACIAKNRRAPRPGWCIKCYTMPLTVELPNNYQPYHAL